MGWRRAGVIGTIAATVLLAALALLAYADALSISLIGAAPGYENLARHYLGEPIGERASFDDLRPFCGTAAILAETTKPAREQDCLELARQDPQSCVPVAASTRTPNFVLPFFDTIETTVAITGPHLEGLADYFATYEPATRYEADELSLRQTHVVFGSKKVTVKRCVNYGYIWIEQNYYALTPSTLH